MSYVVFSIIFFDFEEFGGRKVMKIGVKMDKRGKEKLREQKKSTIGSKRRQKEPHRRPWKGGGSAKRAPIVIDGMAELLISEARGLP